MYHQFIETPSCKGHSWPGFSHLEDRRIPTFIFVSPSHVVHPRLVGLPMDWDSDKKLSSNPLSGSPSFDSLRVSQSLWGWTPKWLTKCHPVNCHHILDVGDKCRTQVGIHKKSDPSVITRKSSICFWDYTISNSRNQLAPCLPCQPIKTRLIVDTLSCWNTNLLNRSLFKRDVAAPFEVRKPSKN